MGLLQAIFRKKERSATPPPAQREPIYQWSNDEIPRYPPFMKGLPAVHPQKIMETQYELIARIRETAIVEQADFNRLFIPVIERFAAYAHLLPASQSHHHRGAGGLFRHSLEVGLWALQASDKVLVEAKTPAQRREIEPRWQFAVFLAGLCHDAGKPVTDVVVTNRERTTQWKPLKESLYEWTQQNKVDAYFLEWREGRGRQHTSLSSHVADRIIREEVIDWISEASTELVAWLFETLNYNPSPTNRLHDIVIKADQTSVERDLKTLGVAMAGYDIGVPVERYVTDVMRQLIKEGIWLVNEPGARVWNIGGHIYLVWPAAGEDIAKQIREDRVPGIPRTPDTILEMLVERNIAFIRQSETPSDRFWRISPACLVNEKSKALPILYAIRLRDDAIISTTPIPPVEGMVIEGEPEAAAVEKAGESGDLAAASQATEQAVEAPAESATQEAQEVVAAPLQEVAPQQELASEPAVAPPEAASAKSAPQEAKEKVKPAESVVASEKGDKAPKDAPKHKSLPIAPAQQEAAKKPAKKTVELTGAVGEVLKALASDLKDGRKKWGEDAFVDHEGHVLVVYADDKGISDYGMAKNVILAGIEEQGWRWVDPMAPLKKVFDFEGKKTIKLTKEVSESFLAVSGQPTESRSEQHATAQPVSEGDEEALLREIIAIAQKIATKRDDEGYLIVNKNDMAREKNMTNSRLSYFLRKIKDKHPGKVDIGIEFIRIKP